MAVCIAMLTACAASQTEPPAPVPDPVVTTKVERQVVCPGDVTAPLPPRPALPADAAINGSPSGMDWLSRMLAYLKLVMTRLSDAAAACQSEAQSHG